MAGSVETGGLYVEFGATGLRQYSGYVREEWLRDLQGWRGIRVMREMRDNDPVIGAVFFATEMLLRGVSFNVEGATAAPEDQAAADFVNSCMADMEQSWAELLSEILTFLHFGWDIHEIVYKMRQGKSANPRLNSRYDDGMIGWRKFAGRAQETLLHWEFDESGDAVAMIQLLPTGGPLLRVPLEKALHLRTVLKKNNPEGRSLLRNAYTSWYYKKRIQEAEAIGIERDLAGIPKAELPSKFMKADATDTDKSLYEQFKKIVNSLHLNEQAGLVVPSDRDDKGNRLFDITLLTTGGKKQIDTSPIIDRYDHRITASFLADFITLGGAGSQGRGSYAQAKSKTDMFAVAVVAFLDIITGEFNRKAIPDLLQLNGLTGAVTMEHGDIARRDIAELADYVLKLTQSGMLTPDPTIQAHLREEGGLPAPDQDAVREIDGSGEDENSGVGDDTSSTNPDDAQGRGGGAAAAA